MAVSKALSFSVFFGIFIPSALKIILLATTFVVSGLEFLGLHFMSFVPSVAYRKGGGAVIFANDVAEFEGLSAGCFWEQARIVF